MNNDAENFAVDELLAKYEHEEQQEELFVTAIETYEQKPNYTKEIRMATFWIGFTSLNFGTALIFSDMPNSLAMLGGGVIGMQIIYLVHNILEKAGFNRRMNDIKEQLQELGINFEDELSKGRGK